MADLVPDPAPGHDPVPGLGTAADPAPAAPEGKAPPTPRRAPEISSQTLQTTREQLPEAAEIPWTGEVIDLGNPDMVARALDEARVYKREVIQPLINGLERVVEVMVRTVGSATIRHGEWEMNAPAKRKYHRDLAAIRDGLLGAGCPPDRVREVITETVILDTKTRDLDRLAKANEAYAEVIEAHTQVEELPRSVTVKRAKGAGA